MAYAFGVAKAHTFIDGKEQKIAFVASFTFLRLNRYAFRLEPYTGVRMMEGLAASTVSESDFAKWLRTNASSLG